MKRKDIEKMYAEGLITEEQKSIFISRFAEEKTWTLRQRMSSIFTILAIGLIGTGVLMMLIAHWKDFMPWGKTAIGMGAMAVVWFYSFRLRNKRPIWSELLALGGAMLWLCNLILQHNLFGYTSYTSDFMLVFFSGLAFIPFISKHRALYILVAALSFFTLASMMDDSTSVVSLNALANENYRGTSFAMFFLLLSFWWLLGERAASQNQGVVSAYYLVGLPSLIVIICIAQALFLYPAAPLAVHEHTWWLMLAASPLLYLLLKPRSVDWLSWLILTVATCMLLPLSIHLSWRYQEIGLIPGVAICWAYAIILMFIGFRCRRVAWINCGALLAGLVFICLLNNVLGSLNDSGLALIIIGLSALCFTALLDSQRRRIIRHLKNQLPPIPPAASEPKQNN